jgi:hypothetical protein
MIIDSKNVLSDAQECLSTATSTNVIDTEVSIDSSGYSNIGVGTPLWLHVKVNTAFAVATSTSTGGYYVLQDCGTSNGTFVNRLASRDISVTTYVQGYDILTVPLPNETLRYVRGRYVSSGASNSAGKIDAFLTAHAPRA